MLVIAPYCPVCSTTCSHALLEFVHELGTRLNCSNCRADYLVFSSGLSVQAPISGDPTAAILEPVIVHDWDAERVQGRQVQQADALGIPVVFRDQLPDGSLGPEMVLIPSGIYLMGSPDNEPERSGTEGPQHLVSISQPFAIGRHALTFTEWDAYAAATGSHRPRVNGWGRWKRPAIDVSRNNARGYLSWLSNETGQCYRLPSESEWEYACRSGTTTRFHTGDRITIDQANFDGACPAEGCPEGPSLGQTALVGTYPSNPFGLHEMHGNIWEWVADCWNDNYVGAPVDGSAWLTGDGRLSVVRGGAWYFAGKWLRSASRLIWSCDKRDYSLGFRVARSVTPKWLDQR